MIVRVTMHAIRRFRERTGSIEADHDVAAHIERIAQDGLEIGGQHGGDEMRWDPETDLVAVLAWMREDPESRIVKTVLNKDQATGNTQAINGGQPWKRNRRKQRREDLRRDKRQQDDERPRKRRMAFAPPIEDED